MTPSQFKKSATIIAERNLTDQVERVIARFKDGHMTVIYCVNGEPSEDTWEECELTCGEMAASYTEIRTAETHCLPVEQCPGGPDDEDVVWRRG